MDTSIEELEAIGRQSFEQTFQMGQFYFPKVLYRHVGGELALSMYETEFRQFQVICMGAAAGGPLEFIAHTADSYYFNAKADPETTERIKARETSASEQFEEGNPNASEALIILVIDAKGHFEHRTLPYKRHGKTLRWSEPVVIPEDLQPTGRYAETMAAAIKASYDAEDANSRK